jgi:putative ABC transport system ATP-binding protein
MADTIIAELKGVSRVYKMGETLVYALNNVNLAIKKGEYIAIMGPSGSGKSTLLNTLGGVDFPSAGEVYLTETRIDNLPEKDLLNIRRKKLAYIFQEARLLSSLTAVENVMLPLVFCHIDDGPVRDKTHALKMLDKVGLAKRATHLPHELSGGEAQRVSIARALMIDPALILADEPTGNLDSRTGEEIMKLFGDLNGEGLTIVMVTHDPQKASHARRVIRLKDGEIVEDAYNHRFEICEV